MNLEIHINSAEGTQFLEQHKYFLSREKAEKYVKEKLSQLGHKRPKGGWTKFILTLQPPNKKTINYLGLVKEAREKGWIEIIDSHIDFKDLIFGKQISFSSGMIGQKFNSKIGNYEKELTTPLRNHSIESELTNDILYFREKACEFSSEHNFELTCRFYRSYILSCITLIEAFINKHVFVLESSGVNMDELEEIKNETRLEERVIILFSIEKKCTLSKLKNSISWNHFKELRKERNILIHSAEPFYGFEIKQLVKPLNHVRTGIGGLMLLFRECQSLPEISFIHRLRNAPEIKFKK